MFVLHVSFEPLIGIRFSFPKTKIFAKSLREEDGLIINRHFPAKLSTSWINEVFNFFKNIETIFLFSFAGMSHPSSILILFNDIRNSQCLFSKHQKHLSQSEKRYFVWIENFAFSFTYFGLFNSRKEATSNQLKSF